MFLRCHSGEVVGCHAVILAASSTVLRCALGDSSRGEDPAVVLMLDYSRDQVDNLLDLLYTGTAEKTPELDSLMRMLEVGLKVKANRISSFEIKLFLSLG